MKGTKANLVINDKYTTKDMKVYTHEEKYTYTRETMNIF